MKMAAQPSTFSRSLGLALLALAWTFTSTASGKPRGDEFDENTVPDTNEELEWPEADFPEADLRGKAFAPGARFDYRAQWGLFRKAGRIAISTQLASNSEDAPVEVRLETASAGLIRSFYSLDLEARTQLDTENWRVIRDEVEGKVRSKENNTLAVFDYENERVVYTDKVEPEFNKIRPLPYDVTLDYASSILQLRSWDLSVGSRYQMCVNTKGKFYFVELEALEMDRIKTEFGYKECFRIEPVRVFPRSKTFREGGKMSIWITADAERIPVRVDVHTSVGTARMLLEEYQLPDTQAFAGK